MLYSKQEWLKTREEMAGDLRPTYPRRCRQHDRSLRPGRDATPSTTAPIMPTFDIPEEFGTEEEYRDRVFTEKDLFDEFTRDENGNVVMSRGGGTQEDSRNSEVTTSSTASSSRPTTWRKLTMDGARRRYGEQLTDEQRGAAQIRAAHYEDDGFPGLLPHRAGLHQRAAREELDVIGGTGPRIGGRIGRGLLPGHHADRPHRNTTCCSSVS